MGSDDLIPNAGDRKELIMKRLGITDLSELFSDVPDGLLLQDSPSEWSPVTETELERLFDSKIRPEVEVDLIFTGGGMADHYVPALVDEIVSNQEIYTSYTPYQAEISQGVLQILFEYQSMMAELLGMDIVNASLYDYASALGEAARFAIRVTKRRKFVVSAGTHPERRRVLETYLSPLEVEISVVELGPDGKTDLSRLESEMDDDVAMVYIETPNFYGVVEDGIEGITDLAHGHGSLMVVGVDPFLCALIKPPGEFGADVVVGEGQFLGGYMNAGGPSLGIFAVRKNMRFIRQLPGRLIGMTKTLDGKYRGYAMVLQTREQHIRQEEATSNITTNSSLMAIRAAIYMALLGPNGLRRVAEKILYNTEYLKRKIPSLKCFDILYGGTLLFKELPVISDVPWHEVNRYLLSNRILGLFHVASLYPEADPTGGKLGLLSTTEKHSIGDLDRLLDKLGEVCGS